MSEANPGSADRLSPAMVGSSARRVISWDARDTMLYALGVGAGLGAPERELALTTEHGGGHPLQALPSMLSVLAQRAQPPALDAVDFGHMLHAGQSVALDALLPAAGEGLLRTEIEAVIDKGRDAIVTVLATLSLSGQAATIGQSRMSILVRGGGGFGAPDRSAPAPAAPDRVPDKTVVHQTRPEQALLYRLSGDRNRLHSDPASARARGFARPILHGLCTYGFACRALVEALADGEPGRLAAMSGRFRKPVYPGETLTTRIWRVDGEEALFVTLDGAGDAVIQLGRARLAC